MDRIGVGELRQHASRHLARVARGETLELTDRERRVAMLVPVRPSTWETLVASGRVTPPSERGDIADELPADYGEDATARLAAMRADER